MNDSPLAPSPTKRPSLWGALYLCGLLLVSCQSSSPEQSNAGEAENSSPARRTAASDTVPHLVTADIEEGIRAHIQAQAQQHDGFFPLATDSHSFELELVRVHTEYLARLGPKRSFACVDLAARNGDVYDVDFFLEGPPGAMEVTQTTVHKHNGQPYYVWEQVPQGEGWQRVPVDSASERLRGVIRGEDHFQFRYQLTLPVLPDSARLWLPLAQSDDYQTVKLLEQEVPGSSRKLKDQYGNQALYLKLGPSSEKQKLSLRYQVRRREKKPYAAPKPGGASLQATDLLPTDTSIRKLAEEALQGHELASTLEQARALYDYVIEQMEYIKNQNYGTGDARQACTAGIGNCSEFHSFFIALARSVQIPARFAIGAGIPAHRNEGAINGYHCWAEFYAEGKWWPVDISEADKFSSLATYYFGRHPANRIELSRGRQLRFQPGPESGPIPFFAYPVLEVRGEKTPLDGSLFSFQRPDSSASL